jgi:hypothetical protein
MILNDRQLDELIAFHGRKAVQSKLSDYQKQYHADTVAALQELKHLRAGIRVEGTVS